MVAEVQKYVYVLHMTDVGVFYRDYGAWITALNFLLIVVLRVEGISQLIFMVEHSL